jgi:hypothetical protein
MPIGLSPVKLGQLVWPGRGPAPAARLAFPRLLVATDNPRNVATLTTFYNRVRVAVASAPGTGTIVLGAATANNFLTFIEAFVPDAALVNLICEDGSDVQCVQARYNALQNSCDVVQVFFSKITGVVSQNRMSLSASAVVYIDVFAQDISSRALRGRRQVFTGSGLWAKPAGFSQAALALIECWGAGGGGGYSSSPSDAAGGGGGGYKFVWVLLSDLAATEAVSIGAGGVGGTASPQTGGTGGNTTFGSWVIAYGGGGGGQDSSAGPGVGGGQFSTGGALSPFSAFDGGNGASNSGPAQAAIFGGGGGMAADIASKEGASQSASKGGVSVPGVPATPSFAGGGAASRTVNINGGSGGPGRCVVTVFDGE